MRRAWDARVWLVRRCGPVYALATVATPAIAMVGGTRRSCHSCWPGYGARGGLPLCGSTALSVHRRPRLSAAGFIHAVHSCGAPWTITLIRLPDLTGRPHGLAGGAVARTHSYASQSSRRYMCFVQAQTLPRPASAPLATSGVPCLSPCHECHGRVP